MTEGLPNDDGQDSMLSVKLVWLGNYGEKVLFLPPPPLKLENDGWSVPLHTFLTFQEGKIQKM